MANTERIKVCQSMITRICAVIAFYGSGFATTVAYYDFIAKAFNQYTANIVVGSEFVVMLLLTVLVFRKIIMIEKLNLEGER